MINISSNIALNCIAFKNMWHCLYYLNTFVLESNLFSSAFKYMALGFETHL